MLYNVTKSKLALQLVASSGPYASYATLKTWLETLAGVRGVELSQQGPIGDLVVAFDNNQMLQKSWAIRVGNKFKCSSITMNVAFVMNSQGVLQLEGLLKLTSWSNATLTHAQKERLKYIDQDESVKKLYYAAHLYPFGADMIRKVYDKQQLEMNGDCHDEVDNRARLELRYEKYTVCANCDTGHSEGKRKCPNCNGKPTCQAPAIEEANISGNNKTELFKEFQFVIDDDNQNHKCKPKFL